MKLRMPLEVDGKITISRRGGTEPEFFIEITDATSGCIIAEVTLEPAEFAHAIGGMGYQPCRVVVNRSDVLGKKREVKQEACLIPVTKGYGDDADARHDEEVREAVEDLCVDGWEIHRPSDARNSHRWIRREAPEGFRWVQMSFIRFVDPTPGTETPS